MKTFSVLTAVCLSAAALAACGSSDDGASSAGAASNDRDTARLKLQECLRKQGVDLPRPGAGGGQAPGAAQMQKLRDALQGPCKSVAQGAFGNLTAEQRQEFQDRMVRFSSCMRRHGVEIPTFTPGQGPPVAVRRINRDDPKVKAAMEACQSVAPGRPGGGGGRGGVLIGPGAGG